MGGWGISGVSEASGIVECGSEGVPEGEVGAEAEAPAPEGVLHRGEGGGVGGVRAVDPEGAVALGVEEARDRRGEGGVRLGAVELDGEAVLWEAVGEGVREFREGDVLLVGEPGGAEEGTEPLRRGGAGGRGGGAPGAAALGVELLQDAADGVPVAEFPPAPAPELGRAADGPDLLEEVLAGVLVEGGDGLGAGGAALGTAGGVLDRVGVVEGGCGGPRDVEGHVPPDVDVPRDCGPLREVVVPPGAEGLDVEIYYRWEGRGGHFGVAAPKWSGP